MTWITDGSGTRWVDVTPARKKRKSPRAVRFADIKVGDQLMKTYTTKGSGGRDDPHGHSRELHQATWYYIVTDLWFDPVAGQENHVAGEMVAISLIRSDGKIRSRKEPHTKRGLASQAFHYADRDYITDCKTVVTAVKQGKIVGIGMGQVIRRRPKLPGHRL